MTLSTPEAAALVGVTPFAIRRWVALGYLTPVARGRYHPGDVIECHYERHPKTWHRRMDELWHAVVAHSPDESYHPTWENSAPKPLKPPRRRQPSGGAVHSVRE